MRGLIMKDLYMAIKTQALMLMILVFLVVGVFVEGQSGFIAYPFLFVAASLPVSLLSYDENCKWDAFSAALPVTRKQIVLSKYLLVPIVSLAIFVLALVLQGIAVAVGMGHASMKELLTALAVSASMGVVMCSLMLPMMFKLGVEKGRMVYLFGIGAACAAAVFLMGNFNELSGLLELLSNMQVVLPFIVIGVSALVLYVSYRVSLVFYSKREF